MHQFPYGIVLSTATLVESSSQQSEDVVPSSQTIQNFSVVKKKLTEPDRLLTIPHSDSLWLITDDGQGVGENLAAQMHKRGQNVALLAFPSNLFAYRKQTKKQLNRMP